MKLGMPGFAKSGLGNIRIQNVALVYFIGCLAQCEILIRLPRRQETRPFSPPSDGWTSIIISVLDVLRGGEILDGQIGGGRKRRRKRRSKKPVIIVFG